MGLENLFSRKDNLYSVEDFEHYGKVIMKLKVCIKVMLITDTILLHIMCRL
jgi:hypothetical protein